MLVILNGVVRQISRGLCHVFKILNSGIDDKLPRRGADGTGKEARSVNSLAGKQRCLLALLLLALTAISLADPRQDAIARCWKLYDQAHYQQGLDLLEPILAQDTTDDLVSAEGYHVKGELLFGLARYEDAIKAYSRALDIRKGKLPPQDPMLALTMVDLGLPYSRLGQNDTARKLYEDALALAQKHFPKHSTTARIHNNLGSLLQSEGFLRSAESHFLEALAIKNEIGADPVSIAATLSNLGELYRQRERLDKAQDYFSQALKLREKALGPDHPATLTARQNLAVIQMSLGQWDSAQASLEACLQGTTKALGPEHPKTATILGNLSVLHLKVYRETGDKAELEQATKYREQELAIRQKIQPKSPITSASIYELAILRREAGQYQEAVDLMRTSLHNSEGNSQPGLLASLSYQMAATLAAQGQYDEALQHSRNSLTLYHHTTGFKYHEALNALILYGEIQIQRKDMEKAERATREFLKYFEENVAEVFSFSSERQRLGYVSKVNVYELPSKFGDAKIMAQTVLRHKGLVLDSLLEDIDLARLDPQSAKVAMQLQEVGEELVRLEMAGEKSARVTALRQQLGDLQGQLAQPFAQHTRRALQVTPEEVQQKIPTDAALVEYVRVGDQYGAVVMTPQAIHWVPLGPAAAIDDTLSKARRAMKTLDRHVAKHLKEMYQLVWSPLLPALGDCRHVIISPDSRLNFLSFATLITPDNKFLVEDVGLEYVASGRDLLNSAKPHPQQARLFGNVAFGGSTDSEARPPEYFYLNLTPLPGTARECSDLELLLKQHHWSEEFTSGDTATESLVRSLRAPGILHLATHGFFLPRQKGGLDNPMLRSGLALAGANTSLLSRGKGEAPPPENDGLLTAEEVGRLHLDDTWLVCLSSCETGLGEIVDGEGVLGLRRGFLRAGAQNLLLTLWPIDDTQTAPIMLDFYKACLDGEAPGHALTRVQKEWLVRLRQEKGLPEAVFVAGPFILTSQVEI